VTRLLLAHGALAAIKDVDGNTPLSLATAETALILQRAQRKVRKPKLPPGANN
jgi:hypothetical protein